MGGADERRRQLGYLVDDDIGSPGVDDRIEVVGARHELEVGEDLGQEEVALRVADQLIEAGKPRRPLGSEPFVGPGMERVEPGLRARLVYGSPVANATVCPAALAATASGTSGSKCPASGRLVNNIRPGTII